MSGQYTSAAVPRPIGLSAEGFSKSAVVTAVTIAAGAMYPINNYGESFYFIGCTAPVSVKTDTAPKRPYRKGTGEIFPPEMRFSRLEIYNDNAGPVQIVLWSGFGEYIDKRFEIVDSYTKVSGQAATSIAATTARVYNGVGTGDQIQRKSIVVSNADLSTDLFIRDQSGNIICLVFARTSITLPISGYVEIYNPTASPVTCYSGEVWYVQNGN